MRLAGSSALRSGATLLLTVGTLGASVAVYFQLFGTAFVRTVSEWTAESSAFTLGLLGTDVTTTGTIVASERFAYAIVAECTAIGPLVLFLGAVLVYPASLRSKAAGVGLGLIAIGGLNLVRLVSLFYVGIHAPQHLDVAHLLVWQGIMVLSVVLLWLYWLERWARVRTA